jgi:uncharacterized protein with PIN domain
MSNEIEENVNQKPAVEVRMEPPDELKKEFSEGSKEPTVEMRVGEVDYCPACNKSIKNMMNEHGGKILQMFGTLVVCYRCGNVFLPKSQIKHVAAAADLKERKIIAEPPKKSIIVP